METIVIDAYKLDSYDIRKQAGIILQKDKLAFFDRQAKKKWEEYKKLDLMLSK